MPFDLTNPYEFSVFTIVDPYQLTRETYEKPETLLELTSIGAQPYATLPLMPGVEMHHCPGDPGALNELAVAVAARFGHEGARIHGPLHFTGVSTGDLAPGMDADTVLDFYSELKTVCCALGVRMWRQRRPSDRVSIRYDDLAQGDTFWFLNEAHRFMGFRDLPADSPTLALTPGARMLFCDDGFEIPVDPSMTYRDRADRAPAGYWQHTGDQLLRADS
ncbi:hypothetical protein OHR86_00035 [Streptomyces sp. NBC_00441]|uniref:hypothetical protein n=1 Tax=Streptomyces sp. NBC_00441 TaxID=2975742 RepID=UPI002E2D122F|nr:hypothetical protein [Streptomyces sp. NBC_00441]